MTSGKRLISAWQLSQSLAQGGNQPLIVIQRRFSDVLVRDTETSPTIEAGGGEGGNNLPMILDALPFDTTQITSHGNYSHPTWGGVCHPLANGQHPPAVVILKVKDELPERNRDA